MTYTDLREVPLTTLSHAVDDWKDMVDRLGTLDDAARDDMLAKSERAEWAGVNATVTREFVRKTAKEFGDALAEARSVYNVLNETYTDLSGLQSDLRTVAREAGSSSVRITDNGDGTVTCSAALTGPYTDEALKACEADAKGFQKRINDVLSRAEEIDTTAAQALRRSYGGADMYNFGHTEYDSLDHAEAERALELAALGPKMTDRQLAEFNRLVKYNGTEPDGEFATRFYKGLGGPKESLEFYARMVRDDPHEASETRTKALAEMQRNLGHTLANATEPDAPPGLDGPKHHLPESWSEEFRRLGTQQIELSTTYAHENPYGYQVLGGLLRYGDYDPGFLNPIAEHVVQLHDTNPSLFARNAPLTDDPLGFNPSGDLGSGFVPLTSVLEALGNSPEAAERFFTDPPTAYREDGTPAPKGTLGFDNYFDLMANKDFHWPADQASEALFNDSLDHGPDAFGHALEAATTGRPHDADLTAGAPWHSADAAQLTQRIVEMFGSQPALIDDGAPLAALRDSFGEMTSDYMPDFQRVMYMGQTGDTSTYPPFGSAASFDPSKAQNFLSVVGKEPDAYGAITNAQQAYTGVLVDQALNGPSKSTLDMNDRVTNAVTSGSVIAGIMSEARANSAYESHEEFVKATQEKAKWTERIIGGAAGLIPVAGEPIGWIVEEVTNSVVEKAEKDSLNEAKEKGDADYNSGRHGTISAAELAVDRAARSNANINEDTLRDLKTSARVAAGDSFNTGAAWNEGGQ
ncbi:MULTISPECIES: hypothetical protein [Streptomyces]|uniref:hypothetical protein n=1 Tax=Streptomyces TaxID=1883 RepID=UPI0022491928|nr:hypothetical protein [Streptomyces sp. JHD 1]MCX2967555.1 hypothetical protein [Streptomyces sp. JHD 1]